MARNVNATRAARSTNGGRRSARVADPGPTKDLPHALSDIGRLPFQPGAITAEQIHRALGDERQREEWMLTHERYARRQERDERVRHEQAAHLVGDVLDPHRIDDGHEQPGFEPENLDVAGERPDLAAGFR